MTEQKKRIEVSAAIIRRDGKILATQRGYGNWAGYWEFPGGKLEPGEDPRDTVVREIREELRAEIQVERFVYTVRWEYPEFHVTMHCYLAALAGDFELLEHSACAWVDAADIDQLKWLPSDVEVVAAIKEQGIL